MGMEEPAFAVGDRVHKPEGDYRFSGFVQAVLRKRSGAVRYVVENSDGILHIFSEPQLLKLERSTPTRSLQGE